MVAFDKLTYAGNRENLATVQSDLAFSFVQADIADRALVRRLFDRTQPEAIVYFPAESHVDPSILGPSEFIRTNIEGTFELLEAARGC